MDNNNLFAKRLKESLQLRKMKQAELVLKTNIPKSSISSYLSGKYVPKQTNIYKIANVLKVNPTWLMGLDAPMFDSRSLDKISLTYMQFTLIELYRTYKNESNGTIDDFCNKCDIKKDRMIGFMEFKCVPTEQEEKNICKAFNIDDPNKLFNGELYDRLIELNNGPWALQLIKDKVSENNFINQSNMGYIKSYILPKEINITSDSLENEIINEIILEKILINNKLMKSGEKLNNNQIEEIKTYLKENIDYINSKLTEKERKKYTINHSDNQ